MTSRAKPAGPDAIARRGVMLILSSPSGAGKSTLTRNLLGSDKEIELSISVTTRAKRGNEIDGVHYHFIARKRFDEMQAAGDLLEWAEVHGNCYGTPRGPVEATLAEGRDVLFDIDWQGTKQVRAAMAEDVATVFVLPPSAQELRARLERRAEDDPEVIVRRLRNAAVEIGHWPEYDYVVVNDDLDRCYKEIEAILHAERLKRARRPAVAALAETLITDLDGTLI